jgi:hypothetical protein
MKIYGRVEVQIHVFLTSAQDRGELSTSRPYRFNPTEGAPTIKSRRMKWAGHEARMGEKRNAYWILVGKPKCRRPLGRPRRRWVGNIKMNLREIEWGGVEWIDVAKNRDQWRALVNTVINLRVP